MRLLTALLVATTVFLAGCQTVPPLNFSVPNVGFSQTKIDAELRSITVTLARPDEAKGNMPVGLESITQFWHTSLQESLDRMAIFKDDASTKVSISVKILGFNIPSFGAGMDSTSIARYEIIDRANGDIIFTEDISAVGSVPFNHAFLGVTRARESINRAAQNNIASFLKSLETVDIDRPMFPTGRRSQ